MDSRTLPAAAWHDRTAVTAAFAGSTPVPPGADLGPGDDRDDLLNDDDLPALYLDQYESVWDAMLARL